MNLHFDRVTPAELQIRVPVWTPRESVRLDVADRPLPLRRKGSYLVVPREAVAVDEAIKLRHDLPPTQTVEEMPVSGRTFHAHLAWR